MEQVINSEILIDNKVSSELSKEFDINLMNQVIEVVKSNLPVFSKSGLNSTTYYTELGSKLYGRVAIELIEQVEVSKSILVLKWLNKRPVHLKFNYSQSSIQRLLQQLEYLNILLHKDSN